MAALKVPCGSFSFVLGGFVVCLLCVWLCDSAGGLPPVYAVESGHFVQLTAQRLYRFKKFNS